MGKAPVLLVLLGLTGCVAGPEMAIYPESIAYRCDGDRMLQVRRAPNAMEAIVTTAAGEQLLRRTESAAQEKYASGSTVLILEGQQALLETDGVLTHRYCVSVQPLPTTQRVR